MNRETQLQIPLMLTRLDTVAPWPHDRPGGYIPGGDGGTVQNRVSLLLLMASRP